MALLRLQNVHLSYGVPALLDGVDLSIDTGERVALVGRNGEGKSTLMKIISGEVQPDDGEVSRQQNLKVTRLEQDVPQSLQGSVYDIVVAGLGELGELMARYHQCAQQLESEGALREFEQLHARIDALEGWTIERRVTALLSRLELPQEAAFSTLSGGLKRRVLLARALILQPDILLLDEPSNHLDVASIEWLENFLLDASLTLVFVTHDRAFLRRLATRIVEIDRGRLTSWAGDYATYLQGKQAALEAEQREQAQFDKKLAQEELWIRQGIKARRTRNEGRVRALQKMRAARAARRAPAGNAKMRIHTGARSGKIVIEAEDLGYAYAGKPVFQHLNTTLLRGDKVGIIGPNGVGKSTLLQVLLGSLSPTTGTLKHGTKLEIAYFDQLRETLDLEKTAQDNVAGGSSSVTVNGQTKHIISYLQDFLFSPARARAPISKLSGGERNRLLLAKLFAQPSNLLVLDEPTNDLDVETLELLEELLIDYQGTILLVSHDREFLDHVVTSTLVFEAEGRVNEYVGGYQDWLRQRAPQASAPSARADAAQKKPKAAGDGIGRKKLSYKDQRELDGLPAHIEQLETQIERLQTDMSAPAFYQQSSAEITATQQQLTAAEASLADAYARWERLEAQQAIGGE